MQRIVSFVVLVALVLVVTFLFFRLMAVFLLPMFFAGILVVIFRPMHLRMVEKCKGRTRLAAGLSTLTILAIVLVPLMLLTIQAGMDGYTLAENVKAKDIDETIGRLRYQLGLATPPKYVVDALDYLRQDLEDAENAFGPRPGPADNQPDEAKADDPVSVARYHLEDADGRLDVVSKYLDGYPPPATEEDSTLPPPNNPHCISDVEEARAKVAVLSEQLANLGQLLSKKPSNSDVPDFHKKVGDALLETRRLRVDLLGNELMQWLKEHTSVDVEDLQDLLYSLTAPGVVVSRASRVGGALADIIIGLAVTVLSLYYFLADGPAMVETVMQLSPLDDRYEQAMLTEFNRISRAVVVATLLSAVVQGLLAGVGYYVAGLGAVFLLTLLTMMFAMVPFVGAAAVWGSCCIYLLLIGEPWTAALLAIYGICVVSLMDNVIKPMVLHGQSNLHPLLALLSVLGGAKALGPIGILVGPMVVAFLQAVLNMLQVEIGELEDADHDHARPAGQIADSAAGAIDELATASGEHHASSLEEESTPAADDAPRESS